MAKNESRSRKVAEKRQGEQSTEERCRLSDNPSTRRYMERPGCATLHACSHQCYPMSTLPSVASLTDALALAGVSTNLAMEGATRLLADIARFRIDAFRLGERYQTPLGPVVEYLFGKTGYSINNACPENTPHFKPSEYGGTQLDSENILLFFRVSEIAYELIPHIWLNPNEDFAGKVRASGQHLDTLNEVWWLSRWSGTFEIEPNFHLVADRDVDWRLTWDFGLGQRLSANVEVKRRRDISRIAGAEFDFKEMFEAGVIKEGRSKFRRSGTSEVNILGITLIGEIDRDVQHYAAEWLKTRDDIDAILLFTRFSSRKSGFDIHVQRKRDLLEQVLKRDLSERDECLHARLQQPLPYTWSQLEFLP